MLGKLAVLMPLFNRMSNESVQLLVEFGQQALASGDPNKFLIEKLREATRKPPVEAEFEVVEKK